MNDLASKVCQPCRKGDGPLTESEIAAYLQELTDWEIVDRESIPCLEKNFRFADFKQALDFANLVGALAETEDHHPEILIGWGSAVVCWWTFVVNGLHTNDFILAARTDRLYQTIIKE